MSQQAAQEFIDAYFAGFPAVRAYIDRTLEEARQSGVVRTLFGRRRLVPESHEPELPDQGGRRARDGQHAHPGHGGGYSEARDDRSHAALPREGLRTRMILTVHDELLFEAPAAEADAAAALVRERMEHAVSLNVPLTVDIGIAENWRDAK